MNVIEIAPLETQMHAVKDMYTDLFLMLLSSVEAEPGDPAAARADKAIDGLMHSIDGTMREFLGTVRTARSTQTMPAALDGEILQFEGQLKSGLASMHERVQARMAEMARERDQLKIELQKIQRKRTGARGYRKGLFGAASGDDALQASA